MGRVEGERRVTFAKDEDEKRGCEACILRTHDFLRRKSLRAQDQRVSMTLTLLLKRRPGTAIAGEGPLTRTAELRMKCTSGTCKRASERTRMVRGSRRPGSCSAKG